MNKTFFLVGWVVLFTDWLLPLQYLKLSHFIISDGADVVFCVFLAILPIHLPCFLYTLIFVLLLLSSQSQLLECPHHYLLDTHSLSYTVVLSSLAL